MKKINALLVDDEISALHTLRGMLAEFSPQVNVVATADSVEDALLKAQKWEPDLVFLDIEMPPFGSGFDFLQKCGQRRFGVIFTTAYPQYAVEAINIVQPWAYLVKPFSVAELVKAVQTSTEKINLLELSQEYLSIVVADARKGNIVIRVRDIVYCQADGNTTDLFVLKEKKTTRITASRTLKDIEEELPVALFCRCHHSFLVNLSCVDRYEKTGRNGVIHLQNGAEAYISVAKMEDFEKRFGDYLRGG